MPKRAATSQATKIAPLSLSHFLSLSAVIQEQHAPLCCHARGSQWSFKISQETITNDSLESSAVCSCILFALLRVFVVLVVLGSAICNHFLVKYCDQKGSTRHASTATRISILNQQTAPSSVISDGT